MHMSSPSSRKSATRSALLEGLVELLARARDLDVLVELGAQLRDLHERLLEAGLRAAHAALTPDDLAELAVVVVRPCSGSGAFISFAMSCLHVLDTFCTSG
jgi:hypothetical protein